MPSPMGQSAVDCGTLSSMPSVSFTIGDKVFDLAPEEVNSQKKKRKDSCERGSSLFSYIASCMLNRRSMKNYMLV